MNKTVDLAIPYEVLKELRKTHEPCYDDKCPFWDAEECNKPDTLCWFYDDRPMHEILPELIQ